MLGNRAESQDLIDLGNRIRKRRQEIHLSQEVLAEKTGISPNTISRIEGGQTAMSIQEAGGDSENRCRNTIGGM